MHKGSTTALARNAVDGCMRELALIDSAYGRLVYLAGLIDPNTGYYQHYDSNASEISTESHEVLQRRHQEVFRDWIVLSLERKMVEVERYVAGLGAVNREQLIDAWLRLTPYKNLVPASVQGPERHKHVSDFEAILGLFRNVSGVAEPNRI